MSTSISTRLPPPPPIHDINSDHHNNNLERSDSKPSLTHTNNTATTDDSPPLLRSTSDLLSPHSAMGDVKIQREESRSERSDNEDVRRPFAKLNLSRSMQGLRVKYKDKDQSAKAANKSGLGRPRAMSVEAKNPPSHVTAKPVPAPAARPSRPQPTRSSGGFSSFIRKLTGRSTSPPKSKTVENQPLISAPPSQRSDEVVARPSAGAVRPPAVRAPSAPIVAGASAPKPALRHLDTLGMVPDRLAPASAPAAPQPHTIIPGPTPLSPARPASRRPEIEKERETDPCNIPLPPSPGMSPLKPSGTVADFSLASPVKTTSTGGPSLKRVKPSGMLSLEGFEFEEEEEEEEEEEVVERLSDEMDDIEDEVEDTVKPLQPIRIPNRVVSGGPSGGVGGNSGTPSTPSTMSTINNEVIVTPTSTHSESSPSKYESLKLAGSSPPRKAPVGTGSGSELGRKESKWRKSVMGLSDTLNGKVAPPRTTSASSSATRRTSQRPAPTSYESYLAHQQRIAANRVSCAPTIHSTASVAAEAREIKDKEQQDMADTFFLS